jgi:ABC-type sugar transport system ATPase subunit
MIGRELLIATPNHLAKPLGDERLRTEGLSSPRKFSGIDLSVRAGEIVGIAGIVGAGRSEVVEAIFGLDPAATGRVTVKGSALALGSRDAALAARPRPRARGPEAPGPRARPQQPREHHPRRPAPV